ncbi:unnamed protein product [Closterium sp. NIES-53]
MELEVLALEVLALEVLVSGGAGAGGAGAGGAWSGGARAGGTGIGGASCEETGAGGPTATTHVSRRLADVSVSRTTGPNRCPPHARPSSPFDDLRTVLFRSSPRCAPPVSILPPPPASSLTLSSHPIIEN